MECYVNRLWKILAGAGLTAGQLVSGAAYAVTDEPGDNYVSLVGSSIVADDERLADDGFAGLQLALGRVIHEHWNIEGAVGFLNIDGDAAKGGIDQDQVYLSVNALNIYNRNGKFQPYLLGGLGYVKTSLYAQSDRNNFQANLGLGALFPVFDDKSRLRTEVLYRWESDDIDYKDWIINVGLVFPFGKKAEPIVAPVAVPVAPQDSDSDGVPDSADRCPGTPAGVEVDQYGCELDSDGDGVLDRKDNCPDTPPDTDVDTVGCPFPEIIDLPGVSFRTNSDMLLDGANTTLNSVAQILIDNEDLVVEVAGHTDADGDAAYNEDLSRRRANSVRNYLLDVGVDPTRVSAEGYGESRPVADNVTAEGKARNRRVELRVLND